MPLVLITDTDYPGHHTYAVTSLSRVGSVVTVVTTTTNALSTGQTVTIAGANPTTYNGAFEVTVTNGTTFTYSLTLTTSAVTSITRSLSTATVTQTAHGYSNGNLITISGAVQPEYNGDFIITVTGLDTYTYTVTGTPASPATGTILAANGPVTPPTGTITATGGKDTVPGVVFLDGYFFVMTTDAVIYNSALGDGTSWNALDFISAQMEPGDGKAIAKSANYIIAFKDWSTEFFYDAANAVGSPLSPVQNGFTLIGCANGNSVTNLDSMLFWVSQTRQKGRSVHMMVGTNQTLISDPNIERILNADDLATVHSFGVKISGHTFYVLTLVTSNITIVYDVTSKSWSQWSSLTLNGSSVNVSSITRSGTTATVTTDSGHGLSDGDPVKIAGADQSGYNGIFQVKYVSSTIFTIEVANSPTTPATGTITATGYTETYFKYTKYVYCSGRDLVLHESNGHLYELTEEAYYDATLPINVLIRTGKLDGDTTDYKRVGKCEIIGNKVDSTAMIRWSDDDYTTNSAYRDADLSVTRSVIRRCGNFRRRSFDIRHIANTSLQLSALELEIEGGK